MISCSSPRSSGWRATDGIIDTKMLTMPMPAPTAPSPTPRPNAIAFPASTFAACARSASKATSLVGRLDGRADVDGGQGGEDECLDRDDDDDLEKVEERRDADRDGSQPGRLEHEHEADHDEDQHVAGEHVGEEPDGERDDPHELRDHLERDDQDQRHLRRLRDPALEVADRTVEANPLDVREG